MELWEVHFIIKEIYMEINLMEHRHMIGMHLLEKVF